MMIAMATPSDILALLEASPAPGELAGGGEGDGGDMGGGEGEGHTSCSPYACNVMRKMKTQLNVMTAATHTQRAAEEDAWLLG